MPIIGASSSAAKPAPTVPTSVSASNSGSGRAFNNGAASVSFTAPSTSKLPVTSYTVTSSPGSFTATGASSPLTVTGLQSNTAYTYTVTAASAAGTSSASSASSSVTATTVPQAPTIGSATDGGTGTTVSVPFTANATGGSNITGYTVTSSPSSITGTGSTSPITVSGLTAGTAYTFTVTATNANGTSTASSASNSVTPTVPTSFDSIATVVGTGTNTVTISGIPSSYKMLQLRMLLHTDSGGDSGAWINFNGTANTTMSNQVIDSRNATTSTFSQTQASGNGVYIRTAGWGSYAGAAIIDIFDYTNTSKFKSFDLINGFYNGVNVNDANVNIRTGTWADTSTITSITLTLQSGNFRSTNSIALYGMK
jgi:hypothetical protein